MASELMKKKILVGNKALNVFDYVEKLYKENTA